MLLTYPFSLLSVFFCFLPLKEDLYDTAFKPNKIQHQMSLDPIFDSSFESESKELGNSHSSKLV